MEAKVGGDQTLGLWPARHGNRYLWTLAENPCFYRELDCVLTSRNSQNCPFWNNQTFIDLGNGVSKNLEVITQGGFLPNVNPNIEC